MRCMWVAIPLALVAFSGAGAQPHCRAPGPSCEAPPTCEAPPSAPRAPEQPPPVYAAPPGMFQQPPASGAVYAPVEQSVVEGASITFPALTLRLPSIRFPAMSRSRTNARMEIEAASAPYMQSAPLAPYAVAAPTYASPPAAPPQQAPPTPQEAPRAPSCDAPRAPACDHAALQQRLRELETVEQRLVTRIGQLQGSLDMRAGGPGLIREAPRPLVQPQPALQSGGQWAQPAERRYVEQPAGYITEPVRLAPSVIREPVPPQGRITGIRAAR